ncbi:MAG: arsenate reductase ArsC [Bacilli bacterium]
MKKVLFVCVHNSARSQMAEAFTNIYGNNVISAESAGLEKGQLNPYVVIAMQEVGIDISHNQTKTTQMMLDLGKHYDYVVTVCDGASKEKCPLFPGVKARFHWDLEDPSSFKGTKDEILRRVRVIRDEIKNRVNDFIKEQITEN